MFYYICYINIKFCSPLWIQSLFDNVLKHCRVLKLADMPSCLGGEESGLSGVLDKAHIELNVLPNNLVEVRILPLQHRY
ncbi:hypothetical protein CA2015_1595 [Cyclobacterium amurskyense]|uniref:Uncharacterized protein n=1 Tax=Cyclobacterium amurskyense TaxID=320787 RepID=A0A0H4P992_9BACT|nr:hypothetical protein CA2015_1595 [Cyclobacterium amurskyense]